MFERQRQQAPARDPAPGSARLAPTATRAWPSGRMRGSFGRNDLSRSPSAPWIDFIKHLTAGELAQRGSRTPISSRPSKPAARARAQTASELSCHWRRRTAASPSSTSLFETLSHAPQQPCAGSAERTRGECRPWAAEHQAEQDAAQLRGFRNPLSFIDAVAEDATDGARFSGTRHQARRIRTYKTANYADFSRHSSRTVLPGSLMALAIRRARRAGANA